MNRNLQVTNMNLEEELAAAGLTFAPEDLPGIAASDAHSMVAMAGLGIRHRERRQATLVEQAEAGASMQDSIDGPYVTRALLSRVLELPFASMQAEDFAELIGALEAKQVPDTDPELAEQVVELMSIVKELAESSGADPSDAPHVTRELMQRIVSLPLESMAEEDLDDLIEQFGNKDVPDGDAELAEQAKTLMVALVEAKRVARRVQDGKIKSTKRTTGKDKLRGKKYRRRPQAKRAMRRRDKRRAAGKFSKSEKKNVRRSGETLSQRKSSARTKVFGESETMANESLASELQGLLDENGPSGPFDTVTNRISRIFGLIDEMADDDEVSEVLESAWETLDGSLTEDMEEGHFLEAIAPVLKVIKRCMESIDEGSLGGQKNEPIPA